MRETASRHHQSASIAFVSKGSLHATNTFPRLKTLNQQSSPYELTARRGPSQSRPHSRRTRRRYSHAHAICNICSRSKTLRVSSNHLLSQYVNRSWHFDGVPFALELVKYVPETGKHIQVRGRSDVSFVWRETKDRDGEFDVSSRSGAQAIPTIQSPGKYAQRSSSASLDSGWPECLHKKRLGGASI